MDDFVKMMADIASDELSSKDKKKQKQKNRVLPSIAYGMGQGMADNLLNHKSPFCYSDNKSDGDYEPDM